MDVKPTHGLFTLKGIIYLIENWRNGRYYVGQTVKTFSQRYGGSGLWWEYTSNRALKADLKRYGTSAFRVRLLAHSKTQTELNELERHYANLYNAYFPTGYNLRPCGEHIQSPKRPHIAFLHGSYDLRSPDGAILTTNDLEAFCEQNDLDKFQMWRVIQGIAKHHRYWTRADSPTKTYRGGTHYMFYDRDSNRYDVHCLRRFCDERNLEYDRMVSMVVGRCHISQGFALSPDAFKRAKYRHVITLTKDGEERVITNIRKEAHLVGLPHWVIYRAIEKNSSMCGDWIVKSITQECLA